MSRLVIVESPAKAHTIEKILGPGYTVRSSMGHVRDLPSSKEAVDVENGFRAEYEVIPKKREVVAKLRAAAKHAEEILLAADPDREGEAICWHLADELRRVKKPVRRITFNEITREGVLRGLAHPRDIDEALVNAQQARRVLDRLVGYRISPLLWRAVGPGLSAGRVQSVAVRLICEREEEIRRFVPEEYWTITASLLSAAGEPFEARLFRIGEDKAEFHNYGFRMDEARAQAIVEDAKQQAFVVTSVTQKQRRQSPSPPYITSTLQQEAARKLRMSTERTMQVAQGLYEGVEIGTDTVGLITYMRTDSTRVADEAVHAVRTYIRDEYGSPYLPQRPNRYRSRKGAQDAHEAIRPTDVRRTPDAVRGHLTAEQHRLYDLIWKRFVASQMEAAVLDTTTVDVGAGRYTFRATGAVLRFDGFRKVYLESREDEEGELEERQLPALREGEALRLRALSPRQHFTEPPPRFTEALLVKELEERGIGRPSTYAAIISTIQKRGYVLREKGRFAPTDVGELVTAMLVRSFPDILDVAFTANMESELDEIEEGKRDWIAMMHAFYGPFTKALAHAAERMYEAKKTAEQVTDDVCNECGRPMAVRWGRYGRFLGCTGYPDCTNTRPLNGAAAPPTEPAATGVACPECHKGELVERTSRRGRTFFGCSSYPACKFVVWDRPVAESPCPDCHAPFVTLKTLKRGQFYVCYRKECGYRAEAPPSADSA
jgi:DNA topoisomerase-1